MCSGWKYDFVKFEPSHFGLRCVLFTLNALSKKNCRARRGMRKPRELKVRCYTAHLIDFNGYLSDFPGVKSSGNICEIELKNPFE